VRNRIRKWNCGKGQIDWRDELSDRLASEVIDATCVW
jgi:hypothetical protein